MIKAYASNSNESAVIEIEFTVIEIEFMTKAFIYYNFYARVPIKYYSDEYLKLSTICTRNTKYSIFSTDDPKLKNIGFYIQSFYIVRMK